MNTYQHLLILIPSVGLLWYGQSEKGTSTNLFCTYLGLITFLMYPIVFLALTTSKVLNYFGLLQIP